MAERFLMEAVMNRSASGVIDILGKYDPDLEIRVEGRTPLHWAADGGDPDVVRLLLEAKANVNARDGRGQTALHIAEKPDCGRVLLDAGALVDARDDHEWTPLHYASTGCPVLTRMLLEAGADPEAVGDNGEMPLGLAGELDSEDCVLALLDGGADRFSPRLAAHCSKDILGRIGAIASIRENLEIDSEAGPAESSSYDKTI